MCQESMVQLAPKIHIMCDESNKWNMNLFIASEAERSEASSQSEDSLREASELLYRLYRETKQLNISKTKHFWHMVYGTKNVSFHPLNPFPTWTGPARP